MQVRLDPVKPDAAWQSLERLAAESLPPSTWAVCGDDPLLCQEALDRLRRILLAQGYSERTTETPDRSFDWRGWLGQMASASLFAQRRIIELRLPTGKPGLEGAKALAQWAANPAPDTALVLLLPRLDKALAAASWMTKLTAHGVALQVETIIAGQMRTWLESRLAQHQLKAEPQALAFMATRFEGNLAAAHQEIVKLGFLPRQTPHAPISLSELEDLLTDQARFSPFQVGDLLCGNNPSRAIRVLRGLKEEGEPLPLILWSAAQSCRRLPVRLAGVALRELSRIDTMVKGLSREDPWLALERLALRLGRSP
jgi:DNA polymerase III subunit delta